jgi:hypothetical protein
MKIKGEKYQIRPCQFKHVGQAEGSNIRLTQAFSIGKARTSLWNVHQVYRVIINYLHTYKNLFQKCNLCIIMKFVEHIQALSKFQLLLI